MGFSVGDLYQVRWWLCPGQGEGKLSWRLEKEKGSFTGPVTGPLGSSSDEQETDSEKTQVLRRKKEPVYSIEEEELDNRNKLIEAAAVRQA